MIVIVQLKFWHFLQFKTFASGWSKTGWADLPLQEIVFELTRSLWGISCRTTKSNLKNGHPTIVCRAAQRAKPRFARLWGTCKHIFRTLMFWREKLVAIAPLILMVPININGAVLGRVRAPDAACFFFGLFLVFCLLVFFETSRLGFRTFEGEGATHRTWTKGDQA